MSRKANLVVDEDVYLEIVRLSKNAGCTTSSLVTAALVEFTSSRVGTLDQSTRDESSTEVRDLKKMMEFLFETTNEIKIALHRLESEHRTLRQSVIEITKSQYT